MFRQASRVAAVLMVCGGAAAAHAQARVVISRVGPAYPEIARQMRLQGPVTVQVTVSREGEVTAAKVVSGHPLLAEEARRCALRWRFMPGAKVSVFAVQVMFSLDG